MKKKSFLLSLVFPCFNEEQNLPVLLEAVNAELGELELELIFVDDGSRDHTLGYLKRLASEDPRVRYASFSRNFGHQSAIVCGLELCSGDCCVVMDADMQHPVRLVRTLVDYWHQGYKIVRTVRLDNGSGSAFKRYSSHLFYRLMNKLGLRELKPGMADFYLLDREIVDILNNQLREGRLFLRGTLAWMGFETAEVTYSPDLRRFGTSKYKFLNMLRLARAGITSYSTAPLVLSGAIGLGFLLLCALYILYVLYVHLIAGSTVPGWSSLMIVTLACNGATMVSLGILGQYMGLSYLEGKRRPPFLVRESSVSAPRAQSSGE